MRRSCGSHLFEFFRPSVQTRGNGELSMPDPVDSVASRTEQFHAVVNSIREFDKLKLAGIISAIIGPTDRENCFLGTYYRTAVLLSSKEPEAFRESFSL